MLVTVAVMAVAAAVAAAGYLLLRTLGSRQQTPASYLRGWQRDDDTAILRKL